MGFSFLIPIVIAPMKEKKPKSLGTHGVLASGIVLWGGGLCWSQAALDGRGQPAFAQRCNSQSDHKSSKLKMWYKREKKCSDKWKKKNKKRRALW